MKLRSLMLALIASFISPALFAQSADIITVVDESGSMTGEHQWLPNMIAALEAELNAAGVGDPGDANQYGIVGFGTSLNHGQTSSQGPHQHVVGTDEWFGASDYGSASPGLVAYGGVEDGYAAIDFAFDNYALREGSATNVILVTDEDRDARSSDTYGSILATLFDNNALLNVVVNASFYCGDGTRALGIDSTGTGYFAVAGGGYDTCEGAYVSSGYGSTTADYVSLALATGGAAWDLNLLRAGGDTAVSFTNAFVGIKVQEIQQQQVPEPGTLALFGLGLLGIGAARRRRTV